MPPSSDVPVTFSQLLPTQKNLSELLEKLLTVFGVESILEGRELPSQPLQREIGDGRRWMLRPMLGNDFHVHTAFDCSPSWKAVMQLDPDDERSDKIRFPLCDVAQHPKSEDAPKSAQQMAKLLRAAWPNANVVGPSKRRQLGPPFVDPGLPDYQLFRWLASRDLNPDGEGVFVTHIYNFKDLVFLTHLYNFKDPLYRPLRQVAVRLYSFSLTSWVCTLFVESVKNQD